jgi:hypothetical protein
MTLALPIHRQHRLVELITGLESKRRISCHKWQQLLGELRSMTITISGAKYYFSNLQHALTTQQHRIRLTSLLRHALSDWKHLLQTLSTPVSIHTVIPRAPDIIMGCDASILGMGGWLWDPAHPNTVHIWQQPLPHNIQRMVVTADNPRGQINNSELELAAIVLSAHLAAQLSSHSHPKLWCHSDNMAAVAWTNNGSTSSTSPSTFLLQTLGQLTQLRTTDLSAFYVSGDSNMLADLLSRHFTCEWAVLQDTFLHPLSPQTYWNLVHPPPTAVSRVTCALLKQIWGKVCPQETQPPNPQLGACGNPFVTNFDKTPSSSRESTPSLSYSCLQGAIAQAPWLPSAVKSELKRWQEPFVPWGRHWPHWDNLTHGSLRRTPWIYGLPTNWPPMAKKIPHHSGTNQYQSQCYRMRSNIASWPTHTKLMQ